MSVKVHFFLNTYWVPLNRQLPVRLLDGALVCVSGDAEHCVVVVRFELLLAHPGKTLSFLENSFFVVEHVGVSREKIEYFL